MTIILRSQYIELIISILLEQGMITGSDTHTTGTQEITIAFETDRQVWGWLKWIDAAKGCGLLNYGEIERD